MKPVCGQPKAKRLIKNEEGSTGVLFAMLAVPMFAMVGMAVDYARSLNSRESMQQSLDAAVLSASNAPAGSDKAAIAMTFFKANLKKVIANADAKFTLRADGTLVGQAWANVTTPVVALIKDDAKTQVVATAEARPQRIVSNSDSDSSGDSSENSGNVTPCIHVMAQNGSATFWLDSNSSLNMSGCEVRVRSNHGLSAMKDVSSSNVKFASIKVKGYAQVSNGLQITQAPYKVLENVSDGSVTGDPYDTKIAAIARNIDTTGTCKATNTTVSGNVTPGVYCGDIKFNNATFSSGVYVIIGSKGNGAKDGALRITGSVNGSAGVTFFLGDNKSKLVQYSGSEGGVLKAPTSGPTKGILFLESSNRGQNYAFTLSSCNKQSWTGLFYMPSLDLTLDSLSEWPKFNVSMAVNKLKMKSLSAVISPYAWTPDGSSSPVTLENNSSGTNIREGWLYR